jgi:hypothetical protein
MRRAAEAQSSSLPDEYVLGDAVVTESDKVLIERACDLLMCPLRQRRVVNVSKPPEALLVDLRLKLGSA